MKGLLREGYTVLAPALRKMTLVRCDVRWAMGDGMMHKKADHAATMSYIVIQWAKYDQICYCTL
jgi:hypothetical protein